LKDRLPETIAIGETNFNAKLSKTFAGVWSGEAVSRQERILWGHGF